MKWNISRLLGNTKSYTNIYKAGDSCDLGNYRPIVVLPCFSKILQRINMTEDIRTYKKMKFFTINNSGFQAGHSTGHAIIQLLKDIFEHFEENKYTLGVFIDLSKAFDTVNHKTLLSKLEIYDIKGNM